VINAMFYAALTLFGIAIIITLIRIIIGPSLPDRVIGLDMIGVNLVSVMGIVSAILQTSVFLEAMLILAILAFISTIAFSKYIERGVIIERNNDN